MDRRPLRDLLFVGMAADTTELLFQVEDRVGSGQLALQPSDQRPDQRDPIGLLVRKGVTFGVLDSGLKFKTEILK